MSKNKLLLLLVLLTMLSTRAVAQNDPSTMRAQMKERLDELKALAPDNVKGLNETLKNDTVKVFIASFTQLYNASPLESYQEYKDAYDFLGHIIFRVNEYLAAYKEFTDNIAKLKTLIQNFNAGTDEKKQGYKTFAQNVYDAYKALSEHDMIALTDDNVDDQKEYDYDIYWVEPDDVTSDNIESVADAAGNHEYISTYGQFNAFFSQNNKELGSIYLEVAGTGTAESPEDLTAQLRNPNSIGQTIFDRNLSTIEIDGVVQHLSARQSEILTILAQNIGLTVERDIILQSVWGNDSYANSLALNVQITYLRKMLEADTSISIVSLKKRGYRLEVI